MMDPSRSRTASGRASRRRADQSARIGTQFAVSHLFGLTCLMQRNVNREFIREVTYGFAWEYRHMFRSIVKSSNCGGELARRVASYEGLDESADYSENVIRAKHRTGIGWNRPRFSCRHLKLKAEQLYKQKINTLKTIVHRGIHSEQVLYLI